MAKTTAVAKLYNKVEGLETTSLSFNAPYDRPENHVWSKYTPALSISMTVLNEIADGYAIGDEFLLTFEKREKPDGSTS